MSSTVVQPEQSSVARTIGVSLVFMTINPPSCFTSGYSA
jgi:hypothetical protein